MNRFPARSVLILTALALGLTAAFVACRTLDGTGGNAVPEFLSAPSYLGQPGQSKTEYNLPRVVTLCGETVPTDRPSVHDRLDKEFQLAVNHRAQVELWRRRAKRYFPLIEESLRQAGLPEDLKYLAVAESDLRPTVSSPAGATGLWQFMPSTARHFGLKVNQREDLRMLPEPLLAIGMKYLSQLHARFGSWALAMAAYNSGEARVDQALAKEGAGADYYQLRLPNETERYVYRIAAIKVILEDANALGFGDTPPSGLYKPLEFTEVSLAFQAPTSWAQLAKERGVDYKTLRLLNPHLGAMNVLSGGPFTFRLPPGAKSVPSVGT
ncbi:MAG: lytic transglycosylase domain-containing protein [Deltaproteobacteria bacterium]|nr:lytic transglycosylase domain-containing protein [Deltaproteobacteria bacterium]